MGLSNKEKLDNIDKQIEVLKARKREIENKAKAQERKARTKRLIEVGASVESALGKEIPKEELPHLIEFIKKYKSMY